MDTPTSEFAFDAPDWTDKGTAALVDGDIVRIADRPTAKDMSRRGVRGTYAPVLGPDGKPIRGLRRTIARVLGISPTLGHPKAAPQLGMASSFYRTVYAEVVESEGCEAHQPGATIGFMQHNANCLSRTTHRWPLTGPNWPATSTARDRHNVVAAFEAAAEAQRGEIATWLSLRTVLEAVSAGVGRKPKQVLEELVPEGVMVDPDATRLWVAHLWNGQAPLDDDLRARLTDIVFRLRGARSDRDLAA